MLHGRLLHAPSKGGACHRRSALPYCALHLRHQAAVPLTMTITSFRALNMQRDAEQAALSHSRCASLAVLKRAACMHVRMHACMCVAVSRALQVGSASPAAGAAFVTPAPQRSGQLSPPNTPGLQLPRPG